MELAGTGKRKTPALATWSLGFTVRPTKTARTAADRKSGDWLMITALKGVATILLRDK